MRSLRVRLLRRHPEGDFVINPSTVQRTTPPPPEGHRRFGPRWWLITAIAFGAIQVALFPFAFVLVMPTILALILGGAADPLLWLLVVGLLIIPVLLSGGLATLVEFALCRMSRPDQAKRWGWRTIVTIVAFASPCFTFPFLFHRTVDRLARSSQKTAAERGYVLRSLISDRTYHRGESAIVRVSLLKDGRPVEKARLKTTAGFRGGEDSGLPLHDDGISPDSLASDGIFTASLPPFANEGLFDLSVTASGHGLDQTISQTLYVSRTATHLTGQYSDFTRDSDGDGTPDELVVGVGVHVAAPDSIGLVGFLSGAKCPPQFGSLDPRLVPAGDQVLQLAYPMKNLNKYGDRSFQLDSLMLFEENDPYGILYVLDKPPGVVHHTRNYTEFEVAGEAMHPTGETTVHGVDKNHDGKFEYLAIDMSILLPLAGNYTWYVMLKSDDDIVCQVNGASPLPKGRTTMHFLFPGSCLAMAAPGGRYSLDGLSMAFMGLRPDRAPKQLVDAPPIPLQGVPSPERFDPTDRTDHSGIIMDPNNNATYTCD